MYFSISLNVPVPLHIYLRFSHYYCAARRFGSIFLTEYVDRNKQRSSPGWGLAAWPPAGPPFVGADGERISRGSCVTWRLLAGLRADELCAPTSVTFVVPSTVLVDLERAVHIPYTSEVIAANLMRLVGRPKAGQGSEPGDLLAMVSDPEHVETRELSREAMAACSHGT